MRGEKRAAADVRGDVLGDRPGEAQAVERAGAAADLVENHQAAVGGVVQNVGGFGHLDHEGGLAAVDFVAGADAGEEAIGQADGGAFGRDVAADLGQERDERDLADVGAFAGHVGAGDERRANRRAENCASLATNSLPSCCSSTGWRPSMISSTRSFDERGPAIAPLERPAPRGPPAHRRGPGRGRVPERSRRAAAVPGGSSRRAAAPARSTRPERRALRPRTFSVPR